MTIFHHKTFNETCNNIFSKQRSQRKTHLGVYMTIRGMSPRVLKKSIIIMSIKCWIIFLTMRSKKRRSLGGGSHFDAKKMGFTKNGCVMKILKTQRSKEILMEMEEGMWKSLEKCFMWEKMMRWRRKIKGKKNVNSANGGRKVNKRWSKKEKRETKKWGGLNFRPPHLKLSQPKKKNIFFKAFKYLSKSKFSIQIFIPKFSMAKF